MQKHTSGTWVASFNGNDDTRIFAETVGDSPRCIAKINTPVGRSLESCANAKLIALAPDMLDALCAALPFVEDALKSEDFKPGYVKQRAEMIRALIAKATATA